MSISHRSKSANAKSKRPRTHRPRPFPQASIQDSRVLIVIDLMKSNLNRGISLEEMAEAAHLSTFYLIKLFDKETGIPPGEYLRQLKLQKARDLLVNSLHSVKEIMTMTGYNNRNNFVLQFKEWFGKTPTEYRRQERAKLFTKRRHLRE